MTTEDIRTILYPLPGSIRSYVANVNGYYTIVINENLSEETRLRAYYHERDHIINRDFESPQSADCIELRSHR